LAARDWTIARAAGITLPMTKSRRDTNRDDRLKAALKANIGRRKAQARARAEGDAPEAEAAPEEARQSQSREDED